MWKGTLQIQRVNGTRVGRLFFLLWQSCSTGCGQSWNKGSPGPEGWGGSRFTSVNWVLWGWHWLFLWPSTPLGHTDSRSQYTRSPKDTTGMFATAQTWNSMNSFREEWLTHCWAARVRAAVLSRKVGGARATCRKGISAKCLQVRGLWIQQWLHTDTSCSHWTVLWACAFPT